MAKLLNLSEDAVEKVLQELVKLGIIKGYLRNYSNDRLDKEGIDFLIFTNSGLALPLQVKTAGRHLSGLRRRKAFPDTYNNHLRKHPLVLFLVMVPLYLREVNPERMHNATRSYILHLLRSTGSIR